MEKEKKVTPVEILGGGKHEKSGGKGGKKKKRKYRRTEIDHHDNGSHTVRHIPHAEDGPDEVTGKPGGDTSYAVKDMDELHDGMEEHLGDPNVAEEQAAAPAPQAPGGGMPV